MVYENPERVAFEREVEFISTFIELMRLRMSDRPINFEVKNNAPAGTTIAPLVFITQVENAFKHGIRGNQGYIHVHIQASDQIGVIKAKIRNSNYPKSHDDKSGHGVGLVQVQRRLDLVYPDRYVWNKGVDTERNEYYSILTIHTK